MKIALRKPLSPRETQALKLFSEGLCTKEVAQKMGVAAKTGEYFRWCISTKFGTSSIAIWTRFALKTGLSRL